MTMQMTMQMSQRPLVFVHPIAPFRDTTIDDDDDETDVATKTWTTMMTTRTDVPPQRTSSIFSSGGRRALPTLSSKNVFLVFGEEIMHTDGSSLVSLGDSKIRAHPSRSFFFHSRFDEKIQGEEIVYAQTVMNNATDLMRVFAFVFARLISRVFSPGRFSSRFFGRGGGGLLVGL